jgi:hypothetical protein
MRRRGRAGWLAALLLGLAAAATAQELSVSFCAGGFFPAGKTYRDIYGRGTALSGGVWFTLQSGLGFAAGFDRLADDGQALPIDGGDEVYALDFRRTSVPLLAYYETSLGGVALRIGAGIGVHNYKEAWRTEGLAFEGHRVTPRFFLAASAPFFSRLSLIAVASYEAISTGEGTPLDTNVNLGGFQVLGGLAVRIF